MKWLNRISTLTIVGMVFALPFCVWAVIHLPLGSADVHVWLPENRPERQRYERFAESFGSDQTLLVSWDKATLNDDRLDAFQEAIRKRDPSSRYILQLASPNAIIDSMAAPPLSMTREAAKSRLRGILLGKKDIPCVVLTVSMAGVRAHRETIELIRQAADDTPKLSREALKLVGTVFESHSVDEAAERSLTQLVFPSTVLGLAVCWVCVGSVRLTAAVMLIAGFGQLTVIALVYYSGLRFSAVLIVLPTLVFMLTLSGAVHLVNYYLEAQREGDEVGSCGVMAVKRGWWPCMLSTITTMFGMGSLLTSELAPVRQFGLFSAVGLGLATLVLLLAFPRLADLFHPTSSKLSNEIVGRNSWIRVPIDWPHRAVAILSRFAIPISIFGIVALAISFNGLSQLESATKLFDMFQPESRIHQDMIWFEENIGAIATVEVLLHFPISDNALQEDSDVYSHVFTLSKISQALRENPDVKGTYSAVNLLPELSDRHGTRGVAVRSIQRQRIRGSLDKLQQAGLVHQGTQQLTWRLMSKVSAVSKKSYGALTESISTTVHSALSNQGSAGLEPTVEFTGIAPVMHETQTTLLSDLGYSFATAFLMITPVMMLCVRSWLGGLLIMIPNVLPVTLAFGVMGWMNYSLDIAGILTASVALGIAVDDTLHFVCWYQGERQAGAEPKAAIRRTLKSCSSAMIHTTLISCTAMSLFLFADFTPTQQFARLMVAMLTLALLGDLFLLPALLLSPLGRWIHRN